MKKDTAMTALTDIPGVGPTLAALFRDHGFDSAEAVASATPAQLMQVPRIGALRAPVLIALARDLAKVSPAPEAAKADAKPMDASSSNPATPGAEDVTKPDKPTKKKTKAKKSKAGSKKSKHEKSKPSKSKKPAKKTKAKSADSKKPKSAKKDKSSKKSKPATSKNSTKPAKKKKK